jgi:peptide/nickel transport system permease protein
MLAARVARRLAWSAGVLLAVVVIVFVLTYVVPVDPARAVAGPHAPPEAVARIREALGLDHPVLSRLADYVGRLAGGDLGYSYARGTDVLPLILERLPATLQLAFAGLLVEVAIGLPLGVIGARRQGALAGRASTLASVILVAAPAFWVGYLLLYLVAFLPTVRLGIEILPVGGGYRPLDPRYLFLPALTLGLSGAGTCARLTAAALTDELGRDYVRTARAKGVSERVAAWRHAMRNAIGPVVSQLGLDLGFFVGGVVVVETVFSWPGIGRLAVEAIEANDVPLVMGTVLVGAVAIVGANILVDIAQAMLDPRLRV